MVITSRKVGVAHFSVRAVLVEQTYFNIFSIKPQGNFSIAQAAGFSAQTLVI
jgi:hypothetical protein